MAFCSNCGSEAQGRFCAKCGAPVAGAAGSAGAGAPGMGSAPGSAMPPPPAPPPQYASQPVGAQSAGLEENMVCALCYALGLLTGILFLVLEPYNRSRLVRFHAWQSIFVWAALAVIGIGISMFGHIPFIGWLVLLALPLLGLGSFILWLLLMYKAYNRERWVLPVIGPLAEKQAG